MIAIIKHSFEWVAETAKFTAAVWHEARALQAEAEAKHGHIGF
ncbi:hypothetical protein [Bosea sp. PAMC 26642]|nr:hypothetical protein [Bosea sp. PAMC 26642]